MTGRWVEGLQKGTDSIEGVRLFGDVDDEGRRRGRECATDGRGRRIRGRRREGDEGRGARDGGDDGDRDDGDGGGDGDDDGGGDGGRTTRVWVRGPRDDDDDVFDVFDDDATTTTTMGRREDADDDAFDDDGGGEGEGARR